MKPSDVISYLEMCSQEGVNLQRGMNYRLKSGKSVILMSQRSDAIYQDRIEDEGKTLIYEGHDLPKSKHGPNPKTTDQPLQYEGGTLTQNGLFYEAAQSFKRFGTVEIVKVYEKIHRGIWVFNGYFKLTDAWQELSNGRNVCKFRLELVEHSSEDENIYSETNLEHNRMIPSDIKLTVWKRDRGACVQCGSSDNLHFDHIIPFSKGGSSLLAENIQLLCARHNLMKSDRIE